MEAKDWIMVFAVVAGPIFAVQIQKFLDQLREKKQRRLSIFKTLMSTRAERVHREHVQSLNMIDIEFYGKSILRKRYQTKKEKSVTNAWKNYNDHLSHRDKNDDLWNQESDRLFFNLLFKMSITLGYDFDEVQLKRDCYRPIAHGNIEAAQLDVLIGWAEVLKGKRVLPMWVANLDKREKQAPEANEADKKAQ